MRACVWAHVRAQDAAARRTLSLVAFTPTSCATSCPAEMPGTTWDTSLRSYTDVHAGVCGVDRPVHAVAHAASTEKLPVAAHGQKQPRVAFRVSVRFCARVCESVWVDGWRRARTPISGSPNELRSPEASKNASDAACATGVVVVLATHASSEATPSSRTEEEEEVGWSDGRNAARAGG